jgi:hypothetical protein
VVGASDKLKFSCLPKLPETSQHDLSTEILSMSSKRRKNLKIHDRNKEIDQRFCNYEANYEDTFELPKIFGKRR